MLRRVRVGTESFEYLSKKRLVDLGLNALRWTEDVFLFRPEYEFANSLLGSWCHDGSGGVAVIGQPGIGEALFLGSFQVANDGPCQGNPVSCISCYYVV